MQKNTGYRLEVATVRKLEFETDAFSFGDKVSVMKKCISIHKKCSVVAQIFLTLRSAFSEELMSSFLSPQVIEKWYPTVEEGGKKGILLVVTTAKDGALTGGPGFLNAVGDNLIDSIISDHIPILTEEEKFNETVTSCASRVEAVLQGKEDPGGTFHSVKFTVLRAAIDINDPIDLFHLL